MPNETAALRRPGRPEHLPELLDFVRDACARAGAEAPVGFALRLAVEEVCTNLMRHGYAGRDAGPIELSVGADPERIVVTIVDHSPPFSPDDAPAPDLVSGAEERRIGGLGWHLVKSVVDEIRYEPGGVETGNRLTLVKRRS